MPHKAHAVVWIDHHEARVIRFNRDETEESKIHPDHDTQRLHSRSGNRSGAKAPEDRDYFTHVSDALGDAATILIAGPANEKLELLKHLDKYAPAQANRVAGVEAMDRVTDGELLAAARHFFRRADRL